MFRSLRHLLWLLLPFGVIHLFIVYIRNKSYDWQIFKSKRLPKPVISIGNLQMGGTGKTPLTITVLKKLQNDGVKVGILSRGYKRRSNEEIALLTSDDVHRKDLGKAIGDEPALILEELTGGALGIGADRYRIGKKMLEQHPVDIFLLDDGLQHRKLSRDLDICLIDMARWKRHPFLFPFSYLRDCKSSLKRCHAVILTKMGNQGDSTEVTELKDQIKLRYNIPSFEGDLMPQKLTNMIDGTEIRLSELQGQKAAAFCGIGHPIHFFSMLKQNGVDLVLEKKFPDHHHYDINDLRYLEKFMTEKRVSKAITTEKDAVKLKWLIQEIGIKKFEYFHLSVEFLTREKSEFFEFISDFASIVLDRVGKVQRK